MEFQVLQVVLKSEFDVFWNFGAPFETSHEAFMHRRKTELGHRLIISGFLEISEGTRRLDKEWHFSLSFQDLYRHRYPASRAINGYL